MEKTITIGSQIWTSENLNVNTYRNGDVIPEVQDQNAWRELTTGAWCYYDNDASNGTKYGKLYNWHAVNDPRGLAPNGYHIPTDAEWTKLTDYLGGESEAGTKMQYEDYDNVTNISGFSGLPGGHRFTDEGFFSIGEYGYWWSSSEGRADSAYYRAYDRDSGNVQRFAMDKELGFSVRCLRD